MLIVNADDLGRNRVATDNTLACFAARRISATSAMVFMQDSERAAGLATAAGMDVGLHLNFSEAFTGPAVAASIRGAQDRLRRFLISSKYFLLMFHPLLLGAFRSVYRAQVDEFHRLYGRSPSHYDGHQHMHLATNVLAQRLLPPGAPVRRSFTFNAGEKSALNRRYRALVDRHLARRHRLTDSFFALSHYPTVERLRRVIELAETTTVELMTHPEVPREFELLMSADFGAALARVDLGAHSSATRQPVAKGSA